MDTNSFESILQSDQVGSPYLSYTALKNGKSESGVLWPLTPNSNFLDNSYTTYTSLETYTPTTPPPTYMNLTSAGIGDVSLSSLYPAQSSLSDEGILPPHYGIMQPKLEDRMYYHDEGIGSSPSSIQSSSSTTNEQRLSPLTRNSDRSSAVDSDFADGDRLSPGMRSSRRSEVPKPQECVNCGTKNSANEQWMIGGPDDTHLLCFICYDSVDSKSAIGDHSIRRKKSTIATKRAHIACTNCGTTTTSLWRRNGNGEFVCNACGLYEKLHKRNRPISMKKDTIQRRKRKPRNTDSKKRSDTQGARSPVRVYQPATLSSALTMYPNLDDSGPFQPLAHSMVTLPSMNNSSNILFNYPHETQYQMLQSCAPSFSNDSRILHHMNTES